MTADYFYPMLRIANNEQNQRESEASVLISIPALPAIQRPAGQ